MSSEKERMLNGEKYNSKDVQLCEERFCTSKLMKVFNSSTENDKILQNLNALLGAVGDEEWVEPPLYVEYGQNITLGNRIYFNFCCVILDVCPVTIGDFVLFGPAVQVYAATHPLSPAERMSKQRSYGKPVKIGSDVWVGGRAIICPGVNIGDGSVIGAGSVVTRDIPPNSLAVGNPCRVIRTLTEENCPKFVRSDIGSEKDKMLRGELYYYISDPQLIEERTQSRKLQKAFNDTTEDEQEKRKEIISKLFAQVGEGTWVEPPFLCDYGCNTKLGRNVHINSSCVILDVCPVTIGDNVVLGHSVHIYPATHPLSASVRRTGLECGKPIKIGSDVWIGNGAVVCPGVTIGDNTVIAAGSVVTKDMPPNVYAEGNPCRISKKRNNDK